ncbi:TIGR01457 family HAD-type hydrolase [Virgibacillus sp. FSP13]
MSNYNAYLIDLDGTMYRGNERIEAAAEFIEALYQKEIPHLFLTNNSAKTQIQVAEKLQNMGIKAVPERIFTSSMATARYIKRQKEAAHCFVIGEEGLCDALEKENMTITDEAVDFVVVGIDRNVNYEKLAKACLAIRNGAQFISTNSDVAIPTERGLVPGNGAITSVITVSTGKEPVFIGKPENIIMDEALTSLGSSKDQTLMVGDNYHTDILAGIHAGVDTLMVFTGVTPYEDFPKLDKKPTYHVQHLGEWMERI